MNFDVTFLSHPQPRDCGDYRHRTLWPAEALGSRTPTIAVQTTHPDVLTALARTRLLVVGMVVDPDVRAMVEYRRSAGLPTVYEISDDFKAFSTVTSMGLYYAQPHVQSFIEEMARLCDAVQFSSPVLARKYAGLGGRRAVFMNHAWELPDLREFCPSARCRIGWTGSAGHIEDARDLGRMLAKARQTDPELFDSFTLAVMTTRQNADAIRSAGVAVDHTPSGSFSAYMRFIQSLDAGLAHLTDEDFAQGRSDGKYIEYATAGVPALCHRSGTYAHTIRHGENGLLYLDADELREGLSLLVRNPERRRALRESAHEDIRHQRNHLVAASQRYDFYRSLVEDGASSSHAPTRSPYAREGFHHMIHPIEEELVATMEEHKLRPSGKTIQRYHQLSQRAPESWKVWERFLALYEACGLTQSLDVLRQQAARTKEEAVRRALSPEPGPIPS